MGFDPEANGKCNTEAGLNLPLRIVQKQLQMASKSILKDFNLNQGSTGMLILFSMDRLVILHFIYSCRELLGFAHSYAIMFFEVI